MYYYILYVSDALMAVFSWQQDCGMHWRPDHVGCHQMNPIPVTTKTCHTASLGMMRSLYVHG